MASPQPCGSDVPQDLHRVLRMRVRPHARRDGFGEDDVAGGRLAAAGEESPRLGRVAPRGSRELRDRELQAHRTVGEGYRYPRVDNKGKYLRLRRYLQEVAQ